MELISSDTQDIEFMRLAIAEARKAELLDEVPIGAVVVRDGEVIAAAYNRRETDADPAGHAEFLAMKQASNNLGVWRLSGCTVYVTLEPCIMCAGLMHQARIDRCVFGAFDPKAGALGSLYQVNAVPGQLGLQSAAEWPGGKMLNVIGRDLNRAALKTLLT